tara:strand:+ start:77376 stop:78308 length:933 start_codon:yes stop_codon:yes gene_type:complete
MKHNCEAPVLLIAFNRPDTTLEVMKVLEVVKPLKLYVAIDGPRTNRPEEVELTNEVAQITKQINWDCEVKYLIREKNVGCKLGVSGAITWVFESEDRAIIIEDDIIAAPTFFSFAENLLERYKTDERVAMISANNYTPLNNLDGDYLFSQYGHIWGWATWKRVWDQFDVEVPEIHKAVKSNLNQMWFTSSSEKKYLKRYFTKLATSLKNKAINTWDIQFVFFRFQNNLLSIVPRVNLASNIGENSSREDNNDSKPMEHYYASDKDFTLKNHPEKVEWNKEYDAYHFNNHIDKLSFLEKAKYKLKKKLNIK